MWPQTLTENWKDVIENGAFTVDDESGNIIAEGKFMKGLRVGQWTYHPSDTQVIKIDWNKYEKQGGSVLINYPKDWETIEADERPFQASFPLKEGENEKGKYFIILSHNKDSIEMNLERYFSYYQSRMFDTEKITEYAFFEFKTAANKSFYFSRYVIERNGEEILAFSFLGENGPTIYDITYSSLNEDIAKKHIIFFDMIRSLVLEGKRFFSPFDPVKNFRQIEKPKKVEKSQPVS
jgi:hypothetical protein